MKLIEALGLDLRILLAQLINFGILIFVLWRFAYKPVFKLLEERRSKIAQGIKDSEASNLQLKEAELEKKALIAEARKEAAVIIDEAKAKAELKYQEIVNKSKIDIRLVIEDEKAKIAAERNSAMSEIRAEAAKLIALALEKILPERASKDEDAKIIAKTLAELK